MISDKLSDVLRLESFEGYDLLDTSTIISQLIPSSSSESRVINDLPRCQIVPLPISQEIEAILFRWGRLQLCAFVRVERPIIDSDIAWSKNLHFILVNNHSGVFVDGDSKEFRPDFQDVKHIIVAIPHKKMLVNRRFLQVAETYGVVAYHDLIVGCVSSSKTSGLQSVQFTPHILLRRREKGTHKLA